MAGAIVLIALGVLLLLVNLWPGFNPWPVLARYWPLILIFLGIGALVDYFRYRSAPDARPHVSSGATTALIVLIIIFACLFWHHHRRDGKYGWRSGDDASNLHQDRSVDLGGATSVRARINMPAGNLDVQPGASTLLAAHFDYTSSNDTPQVNYDVAGGRGELEITQSGSTVHWGPNDDDSWQLHFANDVPLDLALDMGAGQGNLNLEGLDLTNLKVNLGAGQMQVDLRGARKNNLDADIEGGVGQGTILLPEDVGVRVHAEGGIGTISTHGLKRDGDDYVNDALGTSPVTIRLTVQGGVGEIDLNAGP